MADPERLSDKKLAAHVVEGGRLRAMLLELWQRTRMDWGFVTDRLATTFRRETWIGSHERRFVGETLYGLVRHLRRVDAALERGRKVKKPPRDLERLLALLLLEKLIEPAQAARADRDLDWGAVATIDDVIAAERKPVARIALAASLPDWLARRFVEDWADRAEPLALALNQRAPMTIRANLLVGDRMKLAAELAAARITTRPGAWCDTALIVETRTNLFALDAFKRGAMEAQDEGSQLLADLALANLPTTRPLVVDLCAGAGGKTLAIAARLENRGRIVASDIDAKKLEELRRRGRRATVSNAQAIHIDPTSETAWPLALDGLRGKADVVFVDAPCSGIGALRRNPEARWRLRETDLARFAQRQQEILANAYRLLAPGGRLVYGTCTLLRTENQEVVDAVLGAHDDLALVPLADVVGARATELGATAADPASFVVAPDSHGTDGFFARILKRTSAAS
ncbi:MAG: RsmB/NOP family class I SAM-dependent RNA methyltransferase [Deltaproteobacteria bacterium]|nr:RsmB/NOP family class I SAM-dependent RNA methyltransferase [Deltaproteobacteria bacterium]MDQ3295908.1 RsmB/NOP family class I SAM-dependent RNA methyltransferase [Myxococcota bacterium]